MNTLKEIAPFYVFLLVLRGVLRHA